MILKTMAMKTTTTLAVAFVVLATSLPVADAFAASVRVKCDKQSNRSKVSVDGRGLVAGSYVAKIISGDNTKKSEPISGSGEVGFDFDSDPGNIAAGATAITANFIQGGKVTGQIIDSHGFTIAHATATCRVR